MAQLDGSDIVYVVRVAVPKIIALRVEIGTRFPAVQTSQGKVLLAALAPADLEAVLAVPSRSGLPPYIGRSPTQLEEELTEVRARGWALADEELAPGVRSVAVPVRDRDGGVRAAANVTVHAAQTSTQTLLNEHLPRLMRTAGDIGADWARWQSRPHVELEQGTAGSVSA
jgi:IclR family pca regulon transcriptional regulator